MRCPFCNGNRPSTKVRFKLDWTTERVNTVVRMCDSCWMTKILPAWSRDHQ
jgi:hypothetical protein